MPETRKQKAARIARMKAKLGTGWRTKGSYYAQPVRYVVPRTMGPFAVTESKYFTSSRVGVTVSEGTDWTGADIVPTTLNTLFCPSEGSDIDNRIGRKVSVYKISLRGVIQTAALPDQVDVVANPATRIVLYMDMQTNGTGTNSGSLMAPTGANTGLAFTAFQNIANFGRFRVLRDVIFRPRDVSTGEDGTGTTSQIAADIPFKMTVRFKKPIVVRFNGTNAGTIGDIVDNSFMIAAIKSGAGFVSTITYTCRTYFKDT